MVFANIAAWYLLICTSGLVWPTFCHGSTVSANCSGRAVYRVMYTTMWTATSHRDFPSSAHFSGLVGGSHNSQYNMWVPGGTATRGMEAMAEQGKQLVLLIEMIDQGDNMLDFLAFGGIGSGTGMREGTLDVDAAHPFVSLVSMIAPSPDWFAGIHDVNMCNESSSGWVTSLSVNLFPYDAGTDTGLKFQSPNEDTQPRQLIHLLTNSIPNNTESSFYGADPVQQFATLSFALTSGSPPIAAATAVGFVLLFLLL